MFYTLHVTNWYPYFFLFSPLFCPPSYTYSVAAVFLDSFLFLFSGEEEEEEEEDEEEVKEEATEDEVEVLVQQLG